MKNLAMRVCGPLLAAVVGVAAVSAAQAADTAIPTTPEAGTFKMGIEPWLGYGQWYIAQEKGLFAKNGLKDVQIVNFSEDKDINAALASGQLDAANIATHTAMGMVAAGLPVKIVLLLDVSMKADAIIAGKGINTIADLKGKQVAYRGRNDQRHPAQIRARQERHVDRRRQAGAHARLGRRRRADRRAGSGRGDLRTLSDRRHGPGQGRQGDLPGQ